MHNICVKGRNISKCLKRSVIINQLAGLTFYGLKMFLQFSCDSLQGENGNSLFHDEGCYLKRLGKSCGRSVQYYLNCDFTTCFINGHVQIPPTGYEDLIYPGSAVTTASWSTCEGTLTYLLARASSCRVPSKYL